MNDENDPAIAFKHGPATATINDDSLESPMHSKQFDLVYYFPCSVWPPQARSWIERERPSQWPSQDTIQRIVSQGCGIVKTAHPLSSDPDFEYRFSFSLAEVRLFETLTIDQKDCFVSFKAIVKNLVSRLNVNFENEQKITTYHLKTIFLWACEVYRSG